MSSPVDCSGNTRHRSLSHAPLTDDDFTGGDGDDGPSASQPPLPPHTTPSAYSTLSTSSVSPPTRSAFILSTGDSPSDHVSSDLVPGAASYYAAPLVYDDEEGTTGLVTRLPPTPPQSTHSSYSSLMSVNPAREAEDHLRSRFSSIGSATSASNNESDQDQVDEEEAHGRSPATVINPSRSLPEARIYIMADMESTLPANDGMHDLRQKLQEIRELAISTDEKARRMHALMTHDYLSRRPKTSNSPAPFEPSGVPQLPAEEPGAFDVGLAAMPMDPKNPYNIRSEDLIPCVSPLPPNPVNGYSNGNDVDEGYGDDEEEEYPTPPPQLGCMHYKRNVKIQCFDCRRWFPCRHCHDAAPDLPFEHNLRRKMTRNMLCMLCRTPQPAAEICAQCGEYSAWYYCAKCKLWDNDSNKRIYHCDDCGICRVGEGLGKDYVHCKRCNVCISISTSADHPCIERATEGDCPLCLTQLFESKTAVVSLPCGHYMHGDCYKELMAVTYKCPVCSKSAVNMELQWRKLDDAIRAQPMPEDDEELEGLLPHIEEVEIPNGDIAARAGSPVSADNPQQQSQQPPRRPRHVYIGCNDCGSHSRSPFHWLGLKCQVCDSYNTTQMAPTAVRETEAERLFRQQQQLRRPHDFTGDAVLRAAGGDGVTDSGIDGQVAALQIDPSSPAATAATATSPALLEIPGSPSQLSPTTAATTPISDRPVSPSSPRSPSGRYFVQPEEPRRPSFTTPRFSAPQLPTVSLPELGMPRLPRLPHYLPNMPNLPTLPHLPNLPNMPNMPNLPNLPPMPNLPTFYRPSMPNLSSNFSNPGSYIPTLDLAARFSPYYSNVGGVFDSLSRSLSPMRYYLQGLDLRERRGTYGGASAGGRRAGVRRQPRRERRMRRADTTGTLGSNGVGVGVGLAATDDVGAGVARTNTAALTEDLLGVRDRNVSPSALSIRSDPEPLAINAARRRRRRTTGGGFLGWGSDDEDEDDTDDFDDDDDNDDYDEYGTSDLEDEAAGQMNGLPTTRASRWSRWRWPGGDGEEDDEGDDDEEEGDEEESGSGSESEDGSDALDDGAAEDDDEEEGDAMDLLGHR